MAALKYQQYLPKLIITEAMVEAFVDEDPLALNPLLELCPWQFSPLTCHLREPARGQAPADFRGDPWRSSWWRAMALREKLQELAAKEGIKPSRAALNRQARKEQEELAAREAEELKAIKEKLYVDEIATEPKPD